MGKPDEIAPAEVYDRYFVPALFQQWSRIILPAARISTGNHILDIACGTGVLACAAALEVGEDGWAVGLDCNPEMLEIARQKPVNVHWREGHAESLPFENNSFDAVVSQFGFMFFDDKIAAIQEMQRVLKPQGKMVVAVCDALDHSPGYAVLTELLYRLFGNAVADAFRAPFSCGDKDYLYALCAEAGLRTPEIARYDGEVKFDSISALVSTERACAWTLGGCLTDEQFDTLLTAATESLAPFTDRSGRICFSMPALLIQSDKQTCITGSGYLSSGRNRQ